MEQVVRPILWKIARFEPKTLPVMTCIWTTVRARLIVDLSYFYYFLERMYNSKNEREQKYDWATCLRVLHHNMFGSAFAVSLSTNSNQICAYNVITQEKKKFRPKFPETFKCPGWTWIAPFEIFIWGFSKDSVACRTFNMHTEEVGMKASMSNGRDENAVIKYFGEVFTFGGYGRTS
jgi:hypothetical protein